ncbi:MAG: 5-formyltetrahydrofolate cyclo-ligase [Verrucomicrobia subdivision 3 bacterium]|nr:5-formyltetrahydrofolate cyclo-ligase [Limisphaerales bacterium]MCS1415495.1 5-formyltetrahydrofolate cyclo-ligase [Limisphaerales bacterium]
MTESLGEILFVKPKINSASLVEEKAQIRCQMRSLLERVSPASRSAASETLVRQLLRTERYRWAEAIGMYVATGWEIDLGEAMLAGLDQKKRMAVPRWNGGTAEYEFALIDRLSELVNGQFGIREPHADCPRIEGNQLDLVLIPGLAFSCNGVRLGRGKGFYDRLLREVRGHRCGVAYEFQLVEMLPADLWDQRVESIVTPRHWIEPE